LDRPMERFGQPELVAASNGRSFHRDALMCARTCVAAVLLSAPWHKSPIGE
jgi:hypothetical protein